MTTDDTGHPAVPGQKGPPNSDSIALDQDAISELIAQAEAEKNAPAADPTAETPQKTPAQDDEDSVTLDQDAISELIAQAEAEKNEPAEAPEKPLPQTAGTEAFQTLDAAEIEALAPEMAPRRQPPAQPDKSAPQQIRSGERNPAAAQPAAVREPTGRPVPAKPGWTRYLAAGLVGLAAIGLLTGIPYFRHRPAAVAPAPPSGPAPAAVPATPADSPAPADPVAQKLAQAEARMATLLDKQARVRDLQQDYRNGIDALTASARMAIRTGAISDLRSARDNRPIELHLLNIQRRMGYIRALDAFHERLCRESEHLLYQIRLAKIDRQMAAVTNDLTPALLASRLDTVLADLRRREKDLIWTAEAAQPPALASVWQAVRDPGDMGAVASAGLSEQDRANREIWLEICSGSFDRRHQLTALSAEAAKCLSEWNGKDLNLSRLALLTPAAAKYLSQWPGKWLLLNGLRELSPDAARYLSQWQGETLSLNGLTSIGPETDRYLYRWPGAQIELIGLKHRLNWKNPGKRVFVSGR